MFEEIIVAITKTHSAQVANYCTRPNKIFASRATEYDIKPRVIVAQSDKNSNL